MFTVSSTKQATASLLQFPGVLAFVTPICLQVAYAECIIKLIREAKFWPRRHACISFNFYVAVFAACSTEAGISTSFIDLRDRRLPFRFTAHGLQTCRVARATRTTGNGCPNLFECSTQQQQEIPKTKENINYKRNQAHASSPLQDAQKKGRAQQFESQNQIHGTWICRDFTVRNAAFRISMHLKSTLPVIGWSAICLPRLNEMKQLSAAFLFLGFLDTWVLHPHSLIDTNFPCCTNVLWPKAVATLLALSSSTCDVFYPKWEAWGTDQL